jgi:hypothetical protein
MSDATIARMEHGMYVGVRGESRRDGVCTVAKKTDPLATSTRSRALARLTNYRATSHMRHGTSMLRCPEWLVARTSMLSASRDRQTRRMHDTYKAHATHTAIRSDISASSRYNVTILCALRYNCNPTGTATATASARQWPGQCQVALAGHVLTQDTTSKRNSAQLSGSH